jgi:hypothetical protein
MYIRKAWKGGGGRDFCVSGSVWSWSRTVETKTLQTQPCHLTPGILGQPRHMNVGRKDTLSQSTYIYRVQSCVWRLPGVEGSIFWKTPDIGLVPLYFELRKQNIRIAGQQSLNDLLMGWHNSHREYGTVPRAPEKEDLDTRELLRRADSAGPVSPTCFDV